MGQTHTPRLQADDGDADQPIDLSSRRARILDAALEAFVARGFLGTTMDDIGAAVGIRGPSVYKHVRSKQELLAELMSRAIRDAHAAVSTAIASTADHRLRLRRAVEVHVRYHAEHRLDALLGARELANLEPGPLRERILAERDEYEGAFRQIVQAGVDAGVFTVARPTVTALALLDLGKGVSVWFRPEGELTIDELIYHYSDLAVRMVGAGEGSNDG